MNRRKIIYLILIVTALLFARIVPTTYAGDGPEYFGMVISFASHGSFDLTDADAQLRSATTNRPIEKSGYFPDRDGKYFSYHFWMYSLLCVPTFLLLKVLHFNILKTFVITNIILLLFLSWWILFKLNEVMHNRLYLLCITLINPILLYVPWSHVEVYIYVFFLLGLLEFMDKRYFTSLLFLCIASLQASSLILVPGLITLWLVVKKIILPVDYWRLAISDSIALLPMAFYWFHYGQWNLIASTGMAKIEYMSWEKVTNLLFDPNFGLVTYYPFLFVIVIMQLMNRDKRAILGLGTLLLIIISMTSQVNWNSGMMYINRYCVWIVPIVIVTTFKYIVQLKNKIQVLFLCGYMLTTGVLTAYGIHDYKDGNYLRFLPQTKWIIQHVPALYNPPFEVFAERAIANEQPFEDRLPIQIYDQDGLRKELIRNSNGKLEYSNGNIKWNSGELIVKSK